MTEFVELGNDVSFSTKTFHRLRIWWPVTDEFDRNIYPHAIQPNSPKKRFDYKNLVSRSMPTRRIWLLIAQIPHVSREMLNQVHWYGQSHVSHLECDDVYDIIVRNLRHLELLRYEGSVVVARDV